MEYNKEAFRKKIKREFENGISGTYSGLAFKDHFDLLKKEQYYLGYNACLCDLDIIKLGEYAENIDLITQYYNIFIKKKQKEFDEKQGD